MARSISASVTKLLKAFKHTSMMCQQNSKDSCERCRQILRLIFTNWPSETLGDGQHSRSLRLPKQKQAAIYLLGCRETQKP